MRMKVTKEDILFEKALIALNIKFLKILLLMLLRLKLDMGLTSILNISDTNIS